MMSPEDLNMHDVLDFSELGTMNEIDKFNHSEFNDKEVRLGKVNALYLCSDRPDVQREVGMLASCLNAPSRYDFKRLVKLARYLKGTQNLGVFFDKQ
eukprot:4859957-Amphidinium_carterae.1